MLNKTLTGFLKLSTVFFTKFQFKKISEIHGIKREYSDGHAKRNLRWLHHNIAKNQFRSISYGKLFYLLL